MSLYKRKEAWYMDLRVSGDRKRIATGTSNRKLAEKIHAKAVMQIEEGKWFERRASETVTFRELSQKYLEKYQKQRDSYTINHLLEYFGEMALATIRAEDVENYIIDREEAGKKPATIYQEFSLGRRIFNVARKRWKMVQTNPFADVEFSELLRIDNQRDRWLSSQEELELLRCATPDYLKDIIIFALHTGCRRGEILSVTWGDIDMRRKILTVRASKNGNLKAIPLSESVYQMLLKRSKVQHISGRLFPLSVHAVKDAFERAVSASGMENFRFHDLRHTFATRLVQAGVDLYRVKELMGHRSIKTTERYAHHYPESLRASVATLDEWHILDTQQMTAHNAVLAQ